MATMEMRRGMVSYKAKNAKGQGKVVLVQHRLDLWSCLGSAFIATGLVMSGKGLELMSEVM